MEELFNDILGLDDVKGIMLFSEAGELIFKYFHVSPPGKFEDAAGPLIETLKGVREADLVFQNGRIYFRSTHSIFLFIFCGLLAPMAMLRLNSDLLMPVLESTGKKKGKISIPDAIKKKLGRSR